MARLRTLLEDRVIGGRLVYRDVVGSTMDEAAVLADAGCDEGTVVLADEQTAGRGRLRRHWITGPDDNVAFSVVLRPDRSRVSQLNMVASLGVVSAVERLARVDASVKWPNDVRVGGKKVAGVLIESAMSAKGLSHAVIGIGLNVNLDTSAFPEIAGTATSLMAETGTPLDRAEVLRAVLEDMDDRYAEVRGGQSLTRRWASRLDTLGTTVRVRWRDQEMVGQATGVDDQGNLLLTGPDGSVRTAIAGEVTLQT